MRYCQRCCYPENAKPTIIFDKHGVCSGCRASETATMQRNAVDWKERELRFIDLLKSYQDKQRKKNNPYDCIVPVSGGKDSTYQVWLVKKYGLKPLLVNYNHTFGTPVGLRNLTNLIEKLDCNLIRYTSSPNAAKRISKFMLKKVGDVTWHYHAGITTFPIQASVQYDIPLVIWGEEGFSELTGMYNLDDEVEFTKRKRQEHSMRGFEPEDLLNDKNCPLTEYDLAPFFYPKDEDIERVGTRGIYISNYFLWDAKSQGEFVINELDFESSQGMERTFNLYAKLDDIHANGLHDYLKYLKFGYGRATDDVSNEIRHGRMTREQGIALVSKYDHVRPSDLDVFVRETGISEEEILESIENMRDLSIWGKNQNGEWVVNDCIANHTDDENIDKVRLPINNKQQKFIKTKEKISPHSQLDNSKSQYVVL